MGKRTVSRASLEDEIRTDRVVTQKRKSKKNKNLVVVKDMIGEASTRADGSMDDPSLPPRIMANIKRDAHALARQDMPGLPTEFMGAITDAEMNSAFDATAIPAEDAAVFAAFEAQRAAPAAPMRGLPVDIAAQIEQHILDELLGHQDPDKVELADKELNEVFSRVGGLLSRYTSGPLPKVLKVVPVTKQWRVVLALTRPDKWTCQATYAITNLFVSQLRTTASTVFIREFVLPNMEQELDGAKKLSHHMFQTIGRCMYRPAAFFKGILLPLAEGCGAKTASAVAAAMHKWSIPSEYAAAGITKLLEVPYSPPQALFVKTLVSKRYALPYSVLDNLATHYATLPAQH
ncbi:bystin, partial [Kipferlia bialata]|eukprot:g11463.t1